EVSPEPTSSKDNIDNHPHLYRRRMATVVQTIDLGVRGLETHGTVNHENDGRIATKAVKDDKHGEYIKKSRNLILNKYLIIKVLMKKILGAFVLARTLKSLLALLVGDRVATRFVEAGAALSLLHGISVSGKVNKHLREAWPCYPIIGSMPAVLQYTESLHTLFEQGSRNVDFESFEIRIPGVHMLILMDPHDREHVLKNHFLNYPKNLEDDIGAQNFIFGELLGRGIFAVDGEEWRDHRKIGMVSHDVEASNDSLMLETSIPFV
ncbi:MAG TPA: hypothetical protein VEF04_10625, partial [Blastocatellia bacterium]|nr:hypothetical protein [Blastocatellia bacterium]